LSWSPSSSPDGRLDLPDDVLSELEWVQASVHGGHREDAAALDRLLFALWALNR
jgi:histidinol phosphatase-like PHP family hydrolase